MATTTVTQTTTKEDATKALLDRAAQAHTKPLWLQMARLNPPLPDPRCNPHTWRYADVRPSLLEAGDLVPESQAERRVLMLSNPARDPPFTTDTLYAGLQLVKAGETARAHRHTAFAMRFIIEGEGGFTAVQGQRVAMRRGDVITTPRWNWHDHGKEDGGGPMVWLDGLDLPLFQHFPVHFVEHFAAPRYPAEDADSESSPLVFPWAGMKGRLDGAPGDWAELRYLKGDGSECESQPRWSPG